MVLTDSMLAAAFAFRATKPWEELTDSDVFAVHLSTGETGYCSIMGNAGEHHSLGFYIGEKGFATFLNTLSLSKIDFMQAQSAVQRFDCINCDFMNADAIAPEMKQVIRGYAEAHGVKVPRPFGWPDFTRFTPHKAQWFITQELDGLLITEALRAATFLVERLNKERGFEEIGFDPKGNYPTNKGGKSVPLLVPKADGSYELSTTKLPALVKETYSTPSFTNDILSHQIKNLPTHGTLECRLIYLPTPAKGNDPEEVPYFPAMMLCMDSESGMLQPISMSEPDEDFQQMLNDFARMLLTQYGTRPVEIKVSDEQTEHLFKDFCKKCNISLKKKKALPDLDETYEGVMEMFLNMM